MKNVLFAVMGLLALSVVPVSGHAAAHRLPGEKCGPAYDTVQIGTTAMADDRQNIIACLETGEKTQDGKDDSEWKAMTSSGGGGITGGCLAGYFGGNGSFPAKVESHILWGNGCIEANIVKPNAKQSKDICNAVADVGYVCGASYFGGDTDYRNATCLCVKK